jgi:hypothetical protein
VGVDIRGGPNGLVTAPRGDGRDPLSSQVSSPADRWIGGSFGFLASVTLTPYQTGWDAAWWEVAVPRGGSFSRAAPPVPLIGGSTWYSGPKSGRNLVAGNRWCVFRAQSRQDMVRRGGNVPPGLASAHP